VIFAHDTEAALIAVASLVNTTGRDGEALPDVAALDVYLRDHRWTGRRDGTLAELRAVRSLRPRLRRLWEVDEDAVVEIVNGLLREFGALPQLVRHDGWSYHLHAAPAAAPLTTRMAVEAAMAFVDLVRGGELDRLRICGAPDCDDVVIDLTKNRSKRFCEVGCGNRTAVNAYRARKASSPGREPAVARGVPSARSGGPRGT
jgi:predicted RNA-binding Zn ribbon-like protein